MNSFFTLQLLLSLVLVINLVGKCTCPLTEAEKTLCGTVNVGSGGCLRAGGNYNKYIGCPCCAGLTIDYENGVCIDITKPLALDSQNDVKMDPSSPDKWIELFCGKGKKVGLGGCLRLGGDSRSHRGCPCCAGLMEDQESGLCKEPSKKNSKNNKKKLPAND